MRRAVLPWFALLLTLGLFLVALNAALRPRQSGGLDQALQETRRALADALNVFSRADPASLREQPRPQSHQETPR